MSAVGKRQRFDDAWREALQIADVATSTGFDVVLVRDLLGRASVIVADRDDHRYPTRERTELERQLRDHCAPFVGSNPVLVTTELFAPELLVSAPDLVLFQEADAEVGRGRLAILERGIIGREWRRIERDPRTNRVTLYGFKGGVGRSTAAVVLAQYLAAAGYCVLVVDLDLESPGVSAIALDPDDVPDYGLVDVLVESMVGDPGVLDCVARSSRLRVAGNGEVWVAPAGGRPRTGYSYLPKLNRAYLDTPGLEPPSVRNDSTGVEQSSFAERLEAAVDYCVEGVERRSRRPDIVLLDSRAGMHDIAAIAITRLSEISLLFGVDNTPTWNGYREMFQQWTADASLTGLIRERLRMVATMVPASRAVEYLGAFRDKAQLLFSDVLYDEASADDLDAFNPSLSDTEAPHSPIPILFSADLVGVDIANTSDWLAQEFAQAAFNEFARTAADLVVGDRGGSP